MITHHFKRHFSKISKLEKFFPKVNNEVKEIVYPPQHPKKIDSKDSDIIVLQKPPRYITKPQEIPLDLYKKDHLEVDSPPFSKSLQTCLIGPPNAGKSSLLNVILNAQISAVSNKSNTTDEAVKGIYTNLEKRSQIILYDTPGITKIYKNSSHYITKAWDIVSSCDKALLVVDSAKRVDDLLKNAILRLKSIKYDAKTNKKIREMYDAAINIHNDKSNIEESIENQTKTKEDEFREKIIPTYLVLNKIDLCTNKRKLRWLVDELEDLFKFEKIYYTSAETGYGIPELLNDLEEECYYQTWEHNSSLKTDQSQVEILEQIMKSIVFSRFYYELPFQIDISLTEFRARTDGQIKVKFYLNALKEVQVAMIVGKEGKNVKKMEEICAAELAKMFRRRFEVQINVGLDRRNLDPADEILIDPKKIISDAKEEVKKLKSRQILLEEIER